MQRINEREKERAGERERDRRELHLFLCVLLRIISSFHFSSLLECIVFGFYSLFRFHFLDERALSMQP